jgi:hypothetical protein
VERLRIFLKTTKGGSALKCSSGGTLWVAEIRSMITWGFIVNRFSRSPSLGCCAVITGGILLLAIVLSIGNLERLIRNS